MSKNLQPVAIRAKKLGVILRDARTVSGKSLKETADVLGMPVEELELYELGEKSPSLPEVEVLAYYFNVPVEHFWGNSTLSTGEVKQPNYTPEQLLLLRQRMIGAQLRLARIQAGLSMERLAEKAGVPSRDIEQYELGEASISIPELEALAATLNRTTKEFQDQFGPVGVWAFQHKAMEEFMKMPIDLQAFISKPINRPYLDLAYRLSEMSVDKLRTVAEGLLEITL